MRQERYLDKGQSNDLVQIAVEPVRTYWRSPEAMCGEGVPGTSACAGGPSSTRRGFLSLASLAVTTAAMTACRGRVREAVPLLSGSDQQVPGLSSWYATTCAACPSQCSILVKQRDGRPIKIEGNADSPLFGGGTCAAGQASVLGLYDAARLRGPTWKEKPAEWEELDQRVSESLQAAGNDRGRSIVLLSRSFTSPSLRRVVDQWRKRFAQFQHVVYDPVSASALRSASALSFGREGIPRYRFDRARVVVALEADFLGTWLSPVEFAHQYASARHPDNGAFLHIQYESGLSLTGSNADTRVAVAPSEIGDVAAGMLRRVARRAGIADVLNVAEPPSIRESLDAAAEQLWRHRGRSLVVSGAQDNRVQIVVNALNALLGNIGTTMDAAQRSLRHGGDDLMLRRLIQDMGAGLVSVLIIYGANPAYDGPAPERFVEALAKVPLSVSLSGRLDETSSRTTAVCPDHHFLESWGDGEPVEGHLTLSQPLIAPLFRTRAAVETLLGWLTDTTPHYEYLRRHWREEVFPRQQEVTHFDAFWDQSLQRGFAILPPSADARAPEMSGDWKSAMRALADGSRARRDGGIELHLYESVAMRDGGQSNNPWLQELPDPISKVTWGNYAAVSPKLARRLALQQGDVVSLSTGRGKVDVPVFVQPGQHEGTISVALGYGRARGGKIGKGVGANAYPLTTESDGFRAYWSPEVTVRKTGRRETVATTQNHFAMDGRPIVLETTFSEIRARAQEAGAGAAETATLWPDRPRGEHHWGMAIDMNACTGCSACVIACQVENNIPVVGKSEVVRTRSMHWMRIDRYYSGAEENPEAVHQPMMCQHCDHAPCETVCPVLATTTSSEGLNQQVYNRCIGTRYCANNCPYKVRRFNWFNYTDNPEFDYTMAGPLARMVLNPDVAVRSRGVMEKCTMCIQRIEDAKTLRLQDRKPLADGDIRTACEQACPAQAIVFGDLQDPESRVSRWRRGARYYQVLEPLGVRPKVGYLKRVRNRGEA